MQGANINIKVWDKDMDSKAYPYDQVDEFNYNLTDVPGSDPRLLTMEGIRPKEKTRYCSTTGVVSFNYRVCQMCCSST